MQNLEHWPLTKLVEYARNPRKNDHAVDKVAAAIREFGFRVPIVAKSDGTIVDGHLRFKAARKLNLDTVPVLLADDMTPEQVKAFRISVNKVAELAEWDDELLQLEISELRDAEFDLSVIGFDDGELDRLLASMSADAEGIQGDEDDAPEVQAQAVTVRGDVWLLGRHRVMCGDSTVVTDVERLMQGKKAALVVTDPPYGVSYADKNHSLNASGKGNAVQTPIENDHLKGESLKQFFLDAFSFMFASMADGCPFYVFAPQGIGPVKMMMLTAMEQSGILPPHELIWVKNNHVLGRADYHYKHEPVLYGWKSGAGHPWYGERNKMSVWECNKPTSSKLHPTMKPVELVEIPINNSSKPNDIVLDLFGGSGTTLIACEKTGRVARLMELSTAYADVIVRRWQTATGKQATLESTGQTFAEVESERL